MKKERYEEALAYKYTPLVTGLEIFDKDNAFGNDELMVIAGGTGSGKSYIALWIAASCAKSGSTVLFINMENPAHAMTSRMISMGFDFDKDFGEYDERGYNRFIIYHQEDYTVEFNFNNIEKLVDKVKPDLLILDLFSCLLPDNGFVPTVTKQYATSYSWYWKKFGCSVIVTEQFNKDVQGSTRPTENQVYGGMALTRKATKIVLLYDYLRANPDKAAMNNSDVVANTTELWIVKDRYGRMFKQEDKKKGKIALVYNDGKYRSLDKYAPVMGGESEYQEYLRNAFGSKKK